MYFRKTILFVILVLAGVIAGGFNNPGYVNATDTTTTDVNANNSTVDTATDNTNVNNSDVSIPETPKGIKIKISNTIKETEILKGKFIKKKGFKYFKKSDKKLAKNMFFTYNNNVYRVNKKGRIVTGWAKYNGNYYYFNRNNGKMTRSGKVDKIKISQYGVVKDSKYNVSRVKVYIKAQKVVNSITKPTDSKSKKLYKCYKWLAKFPYKEYRTMTKTKKKHPYDWDVVFAKDIFDTHKGCCASEASAFAYMAKVCGYKKVTICSDTEHAWVDIGGRLYDPLFAEAKSFSKNYNSKYWDYRKRPAYVKKL